MMGDLVLNRLQLKSVRKVNSSYVEKQCEGKKKMVTKLEKEISKKNVVIVNSAMEYVDIVEWNKAVTLIVAGEAYTLFSRSDGSLVRSPNLTIEHPLVVSLNKYVNPYNNMRVYGKNDLVSKRTILIRDDWNCQYCGKYGDTIDHIMPKSRGGLNTWGNLAVACKKCNSLKSDKTPEEADMKRPVIPRVFLPQKNRRIQEGINELLMDMVSA